MPANSLESLLSRFGKVIWSVRCCYQGRWETYCLLHGEVYNSSPDPNRAVEAANFLNEQENGSLIRWRSSTDQLDIPFTVQECWCHGGVSPGHFVAGWYEDGSWTRRTYRFVGVNLTEEETQDA